VVVVALLVAFSAPALGGAAPTASGADAGVESRLAAIAAELRCLVCQNRSLADSDVPLAVDLRAQMRALLRAGADDAAVRDFVAARYGDVVIYRPPPRASTAALWFGPPVLLGLGMVGLVLFLRRRRRNAARRDADLDVDTEAGVAPHPSLP
jgi:cytochrome c-type biogenesis protein CcmH